MSTINHITDTPLPLSQDFKSLKAEGLAYIQQYGGNDWTNLNAGDPGVTILDQVCYALTELGYCNDFSIADILTQQNGKLQFDNQFYLPENILTTAPVTITDYRKYLIDSVSGMGNVLIVPNEGIPCTYSIFIQPQQQIADNIQKCNNCCDAAFVQLNKSRNLGELFNQPVMLEPVAYYIAGKINITEENQAQTVLAALQQQIRQFIFPDVSPAGYGQLISDGYDSNDILNGPLLKNGWIPITALGDKKDKLTIVDVAGIAAALPQADSISNFTFITGTGDSATTISCTFEQLLTIAVQESFSTGKLQLLYKGRAINPDETQDAAIAPPPETNILYGSAVKAQTPLPQGKYRDITSYYSIQNTFPLIYGVGAEGVSNNANTLLVAQTRQMKGYLTLFDQVLANQFSQLANVGTLFSFTNSITGTPSEKEEYYAMQDATELANPQYPVPYLSFSPTYFYQSLYNVPNIKPLLKDHDIFDFSFTEETAKEKEVKGWEAYKNDPYNTYAWGLMQLMEDEKVNLQRRNTLLDHLLARHGESPEVINAYIDGSVLSGSRLKDKVIFKSLYLQNLGLLSYNRQKSYNYQSAMPLPRYLTAVPDDFETDILNGYTNDFIFNPEKPDKAEKLKPSDFTDYTGAELKFALLSGLKMIYKEFIAIAADRLEKRVAYWLITQRKGFLFIEMPLLINGLGFMFFITYSPENGTMWQTGGSMVASAALSLSDFLSSGSISIQADNGNTQITAGTTVYPLEPSTGTVKAGWQKIPQTDYYFTMATVGGTEITDWTLLQKTALLLFPDFIPDVNMIQFGNRVNVFLDNNLPLQAAYSVKYINAKQLRLTIRLFAMWHNSMRYHEPTLPVAVISKNAEALFQNLVKLTANG